MALLLREPDAEALLPMAEVIRVVEETFGQQGMGQALNQPRARLRLPAGTLHYMAGAAPTREAIGLKVYTTFGGQVRSLVLLYSVTTGELLALIQANRLSQLRTGAASAVATRYLARPEATTVGIFGTGWQARGQLLALAQVRRLTLIKAYSREPTRRQTFAREMEAQLQIEIRPVDSPQEAIRASDILVTATTAREPLFPGKLLEPGTHINAIGGNTLLRRELDEAAVARCHRIVVDSREQARLEAGEFLGLMEKGRLHWEEVVELGEILAGRVAGRETAEELTLFKSLGIAILDVATAAALYTRARERGVGTELPL